MEKKDHNEWRETGYRDFASQAGGLLKCVRTQPMGKRVGSTLKLISGEGGQHRNPLKVFKNIKELYEYQLKVMGEPIRSSRSQNKFRVLIAWVPFIASLVYE